MSQRPPKPPTDSPDSSEEAQDVPRSRRKFDRTQVGGGRVFSHDTSQLRDALPNVDEGDALLDQLFDGGAEADDQLPTLAPLSEDRETETRVFTFGDVARTFAPAALDGDDDTSEDRETQFFLRSGKPPDDLDEDGPSSVASADQTSTNLFSASASTVAEPVFASDLEVEEPSPAARVDGPLGSRLAPAGGGWNAFSAPLVFDVNALPSDRPSTLELGLDDVELLAELDDAFAGLELGSRSWEAMADFATMEGGVVASTLLAGSTAGAEGIVNDAAAFAEPEVGELPVDDARLSSASVRSRGAFPIVHIPPMDDAPAEFIPPPARSIPFALMPASPVSEDGFDVVVDEDAFLDDAVASAPPSRASVVAARESVAGWLLAGESSHPHEELEEFVLSIEDVEDVPPSVLPVPSARRPLEALDIFAEPSGDIDAAVVTLIERGERTAWIARAHRLLTEAPTESAPARASSLLIVSELFAIGGESELAEKTAIEALTLAPTSPMIQRQVRCLQAARRAWPEVVEQLTREARTAPTDASRAHAAYLATEVARLKLSDMEGVTRMVERVRAADPTDVRGPLAQWVANAKNREALLDAPQGPAEAAFVAAEAELAAVRSNGADGARAQTRFGRLLAARVGLRRRDADTAVSLLLDVGNEPGLGGAAAWLAAVLGAPNGELRARVSGALDRARKGSHAAMAKRLGVAHALERGDSAAVAAAIREADDLAPNDRLFLAAMLPACESVPPIAELLAASAATDSAERPLVAAAAAMFGASLLASEALGNEHGKLRVAIARQLASLGSHAALEDAHVVLAPTIDALRELEPDDGLARAFAVETRFVEGRQEKLLASLAGGRADERALVAGLFAELAGDVDAMMTAVEPFASENSAALRMFVTHSAHEAGASALERSAASVDDATAALYLTEAAVKVGGDAVRADAFWARVYERDDQSPVAPLFGFAGALRTGVRASARQWLTRCKLDPVHEQILDALRLTPLDSPERLQLLTDAQRQKPADIALRERFEAAGGGVDDRAAWLEDRSAEAGVDAVSFALEAALLYECQGDLASAARTIRGAVQRSPLAESFARRLALQGHGTQAAVDRVASLRLRAEEAEERRDLDAELARLAWHGRGDFSAAARHWRDMLEVGSLDIVALLEAERMFFHVDDPQNHAWIEFALARATTGSEGLAHAMLAVRRALRSDQQALALDAARQAAVVSRRGSWALRQLSALSQLRCDFAGMWRAACDLAERTTRPLERAALLCRAAEAAFSSGDDASANSLLGDVFSAWPRHPVARLLRASVLERSGAILQAAVAYEELAGMTRSRRDRAQRCYKAATLWLGSNDPRAAIEGQRLLEAACDLDPQHVAAFERLQAIYLAGGARMELAELLSQRVRTVVDPTQRGELEVLRGRMLAEAGASSEAKVALAASLKVRPDDVAAWRAYADVAITEQDGEAAEQALLQLGRLVTDPNERVDVYIRLGDVYSRLRPNHERARRAYREAEKLDPTRIDVRERWIELQAAMGDPAGALAAQRALCEQATQPQDVCARTIALSWLHERVREVAEAEKVLLELRRQHALEPHSLKALHAFYVRQSKRGLADALLERTLHELSRLLVSGRMDDGVFEIAKAVAELRGRVDGIAVAEAVRTAAHGGPSRIGAAGVRATDRGLDDLLAPEVFGPEFRELLAATGGLLDAATPFDSRAMRTRPLTHHDDLIVRAREIAAQHGLPDVDFVVANALSATIVPVSMSPAVFCVAAQLLDADNSALFELAFHRAATLVRSGTAAFARTAPIDQFAVLVAYLRLHDPTIVPMGVDLAKVAEVESRMRAVAQSFVAEPRLVALARYVFDSIGLRGSSLGGSAAAWSWHVTAVAVGDISLTLDAMALATAAAALPASGGERLRWLAKHSEARELFGFLVSDAHLEVRTRLGLIVPMPRSD